MSSAIYGRAGERIALSLAVGVALSTLALPVGAGPGDRAREQAEQAATSGFEAYDAGDYASAITFFERAHALAPTPGLLFNVAQAYRHLGASGCGPALEYYERYRDALRAEDAPVPPGLRARIVEMQDCLDRQAKESSSASWGPTPPEPVAPLSDQPSEGVTMEAPERGGKRRRAGWIVGGAGVAVSAVAAVSGALALQRESELLSRCMAAVCPPSLAGGIASYDRLRVTAFVSGAVGVAALATSAYLLLTSPSGGGASGTPAGVGRRAQIWTTGRAAVLRWTF